MPDLSGPSAAPDILADAARRWGLEPSELEHLGAFESAVYAWPGGILKILDPARRDADLVRAEADWLEHLSARGVAVAEPIPSVHGRAVEEPADAEGRVAAVAIAYRRLEGREPDPSWWDEDLFERWGELVGAVQAGGVDFRPAPGRPRRFRADDDWAKLEAAAATDATRDRIAQARATLASLPAADVALVHRDLHVENILDDGGTLGAFDFDDSCYDRLGYDLAIAPYYAAAEVPEVEREAFLERFLPAYLRGVRRRSPIGPDEIARLPLYLRLRRVELLGVVEDMWGAEPEGEEERRIAERIRGAVEAGVAIPGVRDAALERLVERLAR